MLGIDIRYRYGEVPITIAKVIRLCAAVVYGQFQLECLFIIRQVDKAEGIKTSRSATFRPKAVS